MAWHPDGEKPHCDTCLFWEKPAGGSGTRMIEENVACCLRFPPSPLLNPGPYMWPLTKQNMGCGEHRDAVHKDNET